MSEFLKLTAQQGAAVFVSLEHIAIIRAHDTGSEVTIGGEEYRFQEAPAQIIALIEAAQPPYGMGM